jgi:sulfur-oxidizing protein SoxA
MKKTALLMASAAAVATAALAEPDMTAVLEIDGELITTHVAEPGEGNPLPELISGWHFRNPDTRDLEADDFENPAFVYVGIGEELWEAAEGASGQSCADCHGDVDSFAGCGRTCRNGATRPASR